MVNRYTSAAAAILAESTMKHSAAEMLAESTMKHSAAEM